MSNLCNNRLKLIGDSSFLQELFESITKERKFFEFISPIPKNISESVNSFCRTEWGTKWDYDNECDVVFTEGKKTSGLSMYFQTPWSPPIGIYEKLVEMGVQVEGYYFESGLSFYGHFTNEDGNNEGQYNSLSEIPEYIVNVFELTEWIEEQLE